MSYESFVQALQPAIAERVEEKNPYNRFQTVEQVVPQGDEALEGSSIIDVFNYFFQRAVSSSDQKAFKEGQPGLPKTSSRVPGMNKFGEGHFRSNT